MKAWMMGAALALWAGSAWADVEVVGTEFVPADIATHFNMTVKNHSGEAIARLEYDALFETPGRSVPWGDIVHGIDVPGGIEPGEARTLEVLRVPERMRYVEDDEVSVVIRRLTAYGPDGAPIE